MNFKKNKIEKRYRIKKRIRSKIFGTSSVPRLAVFKSNKKIYAQIIDDTLGKTLVYSSDLKILKGNSMERAKEVGRILAENAKKFGIKKVVFDRGGFKYIGRIKQLADSARESGLIF